MKRIDLHIHTVSAKEEEFEFDLELLKVHVKEQRLDAIALTNHNTLDLQNYEEVRTALAVFGCVVFPGVELDALGTHILLITDHSNANALSQYCTAMAKWPETVDELVSCFPIIGDCVVIPHYGKDPSITEDALAALFGYVDAVETSSLKKAIRLAKSDTVDLPVVCFTDFRFGGNGTPKAKSVYIDTDNLTVKGIKAAMKADRGIRYNVDGTYQLEIAPGIMASDSLNLIIGRRSTGKTYTLEHVEDLCDDGDVYCIRQGTLVADSTEDEFAKHLAKRFSSHSSSYYDRWVPLLKDAKVIGNESARQGVIRNYLTALKKYADSSTLADSFSACHLFKEVPLDVIDCDEDLKVINAVITLLTAMDSKTIIEKHVQRHSLIMLLSELVDFARQRAIENAAIVKCNEITAAIKRRLTVRSSQDEYPEPILSKSFKQYVFISRCIDLLNKCWKRMCVYDDNGALAEKYIVYGVREPYAKVEDLKSCAGITDSLGRLTGKKADKFFDFIIGRDDCDEHPAALFRITFKARDDKGADLSGGQRTEFIFMDRLTEAENYPVVLIDEPESSFDNIFLDEHIADKIRGLASHATVFVSSHNQVLSFALKPKKVFYTHYDRDKQEYGLFGGELLDPEITNQTGSRLSTRQTLQQLLEAGETSFKQRKSYYEGA